jgi:hypothetical protein
MSVDPSAPGTFWYTDEYYSSTSDASWQTRIASFSLGNVFSSYATASPGHICVGNDSIQLRSIVYGGSGTYSWSWSSIPAGFSSTLQNPKCAPIINTKFICSVSDGSNTRIDSTLTVIVEGIPYSYAGNDTVVDPSVVSIDLHGIAENYRIFQWQTTGNGSFSSVSQLNTTYTFGSTDLSSGIVSLKLVAVANPPCTGTYASTMAVHIWPAGIQDKSSNKIILSIQPNPARETVSVIIDGIENTPATLTLLNMNGQIVYTDNLTISSSAITKQINLAGFARGIYSVRLRTENAVETRKLVVQ